MRVLKISAFVLVCILFFSTVSHAGFISEITEAAFQKAVLESDEPVIVWFNSGSTYGKLADDIDRFVQKKSPVKVLKMDKNFNSLTAGKYKIKRNNTFVFFADGVDIERTTSIKSIEDFEEFVKHCLVEYYKALEDERQNEWKPSVKKEK